MRRYKLVALLSVSVFIALSGAVYAGLFEWCTKTGGHAWTCTGKSAMVAECGTPAGRCDATASAVKHGTCTPGVDWCPATVACAGTCWGTTTVPCSAPVAGCP